jgi:thiamine pyrophosphate-dependent acetolactate synthase large subunit-like protein
MALTEIAEELYADADFILALDTMDLYGALHTVDRLTRETKPMYRPGTVIAHVTLDNYMVRSWSHDFRRLQQTDDAIAADTSGFVPALLALCAAQLPTRPGAAARVQQRGQRWQGRAERLRTAWQAQAEAARGQTPIALSALAATVWDAIKDQDWVLANGTANGWAKRLWDISRPDQYLGKNSGGGLGYGIGASIGAALAFPDRLCVNLQGDGDFLFTPTALWTAAHHDTPTLTILVNNRSYYNSEEHNAKIARHRGRPVENAGQGTRIEDPAFDFAAMARSMGLYAEGAITRCEDLGPALQRAVKAVLEQRQSALVDVLTQNR